jgi:hypothetical protein
MEYVIWYKDTGEFFEGFRNNGLLRWTQEVKKAKRFDDVPSAVLFVVKELGLRRTDFEVVTIWNDPSPTPNDPKEYESRESWALHGAEAKDRFWKGQEGLRVVFGLATVALLGAVLVAYGVSEKAGMWTNLVLCVGCVVLILVGLVQHWRNKL